VAQVIYKICGADEWREAERTGAFRGPALRWEPSRGGALFPHLYGVLTFDAVLWVRPLPLGKDGAHMFPELAS
jgi:uncharacterized protein (DUF952 family)